MKNKKHLIDSITIERSEIRYIIELANKLEAMPRQEVCKLGQGLVAACVFSKPSLRTSSMIFSSASRIGGACLNLSFTEESQFEEIVGSITSFVDLLFVRDNSLDLKNYSGNGDFSIINSLCGNAEHTLSGFWQLTCLNKLLGSLDNLRLGIYGQTLHCRPYNTLQLLLSKFNCTIYHDPVLEELGNSPEISKFLSVEKCNYNVARLQDFIAEIDILIISDGLPIESQCPLTNTNFSRYEEKFVPLSKKILSALPSKAYFNFMEPNFLISGRRTVLPEVLSDPRLYNARLMSDGLYSTMAIMLLCGHNENFYNEL